MVGGYHAGLGRALRMQKWREWNHRRLCRASTSSDISRSYRIEKLLCTYRDANRERSVEEQLEKKKNDYVS